MFYTRKPIIAFAATVATVSASMNAWSSECCDPTSPFVLGEAFPENPASCETANRWIEEAPEIDARISFTIAGALSEVHSDGALAYLIMCEPDNVQVICVTYSTNDLERGDVVLLAGGYSRIGDQEIMLDPCLPYEAP